MTAKELQEKCMALQRECNDKQSELRKQYAIEHNPVKVGDIVAEEPETPSGGGDNNGGGNGGTTGGELEG